MAKRLRTSSPPMNVQYKKLVSQDLISLRALQETCDDHNIIGNEVRYIIMHDCTLDAWAWKNNLIMRIEKF